MSNVHPIILWYIGVVNIAAVLLYGWDKYCAIQHRWRIRERTLLLVAVLGGSMGAMVGMEVFRHKTLHWKFRIGVPLILAIQLTGLVYVYS